MSEVYHLYIKTDCPYCKEAIDILQKRKESFSVTVLDHCPQVHKNVKEEYNWETVPVVLLNENYEESPASFWLIGGCDDLKSHLKEKEESDDEEKQEKS